MAPSLLPVCIAAALLCHLGYAWARMLLPPNLSAGRWLWTPLIGFALFTVVVAPLTNLTALTPVQTAVGMTIIAVPLNGLAWWRTRRQPLPPGNRSHGLLILALTLLVCLGALIPVLHHGPAPIGENWDVSEFYLPLGRALQSYSQRDFFLLPDNPVVRILTTPPVNARIHAFSYLHATVSAWSGVEPLNSFPTLMAMFLALSVPATALLSRSLGLGQRAIWLAAALAGMNWLLLWATYNGFAMHATAFALLPAALAATLAVLRLNRLHDTSGARAILPNTALATPHAGLSFSPAIGQRLSNTPPDSALQREILTAGLLVGGLALAYQPALTAYVFWVAALVGFGLLRCWFIGAERWAAMGALLGRTFLLGGLAFLLSSTGQYFLFLRDGFLAQYAERSGGMGIDTLTPLGAALGLDPAWQGIAPLAEIPVQLGMLAAGGLALLALGRRPAILLVLLASALVYQGLMFTLDYAYGYYKGVTFAIPLLAIALASGIESQPFAWNRWLQRALLASSLSLALLMLAAIAASWLGAQRSYLAGDRRLFAARELELSELRQMIPPGADVLIVPPADQAPVLGGLLGYELLGYRLQGSLRSGYNAMHRPLPPGHTTAFGLLAAETDPASFGYTRDGLRWSGLGMHLYQRTAATLFSYLPPDRLVLSPGQSLSMDFGADQLVLADMQPIDYSQAMRDQPQAALTLSSFAPARLEFQVGAAPPQQVTLPGGMAVLSSAVLTLPTQITLRNVDNVPVNLWQIALRRPDPSPNLMAQDDVLLQITSRYDAERFTAAMQLHTPLIGPELHQKLTALLVFSHQTQGQDWREVGRWVFFPSQSPQIQISADLRDHSANLMIDQRAADLFGTAEPPMDGAYQASLLLANNTKIVAAYGIWHWKRSNGHVFSTYVDDVGVERVQLPAPVTVLNYATEDAQLALRGVTIPARQIQAGEQLEVTLVWQALAHLEQDYAARLSLFAPGGAVLATSVVSLGAPNHPPTRWQEGELGERTTLIALPPDAAEGQYVLTIELVAPTGAVIPLQTPTGLQQPIDVATIEVVHR
jgi:hypothetical protein